MRIPQGSNVEQVRHELRALEPHVPLRHFGGRPAKYECANCGEQYSQRVNVKSCRVQLYEWIDGLFRAARDRTLSVTLFPGQSGELPESYVRAQVDRVLLKRHKVDKANREWMLYEYDRFVAWRDGAQPGRTTQERVDAATVNLEQRMDEAMALAAEAFRV